MLLLSLEFGNLFKIAKIFWKKNIAPPFRILTTPLM